MIESVISLTIFCSLITISIHGLKNYQQVIEEKQIIGQFKMNWRNMLNYSYLNKRESKFIYNYDANSITFRDAHNRNRFYHRLQLPLTLKSSRGRDMIISVSDKGTTSPNKIQFQSSLTNKSYLYTIQMMWGELIEK